MIHKKRDKIRKHTVFVSQNVLLVNNLPHDSEFVAHTARSRRQRTHRRRCEKEGCREKHCESCKYIYINKDYIKMHSTIRSAVHKMHGTLSPQMHKTKAEGRRP